MKLWEGAAVVGAAWALWSCVPPPEPTVTAPEREATREAPVEGPVSFERTYDEFTRRTRVVLRLQRLQPSVMLLASTGSGTWALGFTGVHDSSVYLRCRHVDALVNEEPYPMPNFELGRVSHSYGATSESISAIFDDLSTLRAIASAQRVRFRVCTDVIALTPDHLAGVREFLRAVEGAAGDAGAP